LRNASAFATSEFPELLEPLAADDVVDEDDEDEEDEEQAVSVNAAAAAKTVSTAHTRWRWIWVNMWLESLSVDTALGGVSRRTGCCAHRPEVRDESLRMAEQPLPRAPESISMSKVNIARHAKARPSSLG
jgi:hypothetical protein